MSTDGGIDSTSPAFAQLTTTNHGPLIIVATYIFLIISLLAIAVKLLTRYQTTRKLIWNDYLILTTAVLAIAQSMTLTISVRDGLGKHIENASITTTKLKILSEAYYASNILLVATVGGAKASVSLLIISIKPARRVMLACYGVLAFTAAWMIGSILALAFQCELPNPWRLGPDTCVNQYALQLGIGITNIVSDLFIVALPFFMMRTVQVANQKRWIVIALFALRIATPAFEAVALATFHPYFYSTPQDRTWHIVAPTIWRQAMLHASIITACIPSIKRFLADIQSGLMGAGISEYYEHTHSGGKAGYGSQSYAKGTGLGSRLAARLGVSSRGGGGSGSALRSRTEKDSRPDHNQGLDLGNLQTHKTTTYAKEPTESVKGLTDDVIMQTIDYKVEYEDTNTSEGGCSNRSREQGQTMGIEDVHAVSSYGHEYGQPTRMV